MAAERQSMTVTMHNLTDAQAIALEAMFRLWQNLGAAGCSRYVSFFADGDGNFRPRVEIQHSRDPYPTQTEEDREALRKAAFVTNGEEEQGLSIPIDFDPVAWRLHEPEMQSRSPKVQAIKEHVSFVQGQQSVVPGHELCPFCYSYTQTNPCDCCTKMRAPEPYDLRGGSDGR
jgi:hypothetical protein